MINEAIQWLALGGLCAGFIRYRVRINRWQRQVERRLAQAEVGANDQAKINKALRTEFLRFSSPEAISDEMVTVANLIEARQARRQAMPQGSQGPSAKITKAGVSHLYPVRQWQRKRDQ